MSDEKLSAFLASKKEDDDDAGEDVNPEEEVKGDWKAVDLPEVEVKTGEEDKDLIFKSDGKLYRWNDEQWKERGTGFFKLLRDKSTQKVTFVMRQNNTKKVVANFLVEEDPLCALVSHSGSDKAWIWMAHDYSDGQMLRQKFALRLGTPEKAQEFKSAFEDAKNFNSCIKTGKPCVPAPVIEDTKTDTN